MKKIASEYDEIDSLLVEANPEESSAAALAVFRVALRAGNLVLGDRDPHEPWF